MDIRKVMGRRAVEKGLDKALFQKNHALDDLFDIKVKNMEMKKDKLTGEIPIVPMTGVACKDKEALNELVRQVITKRGYNPYKVMGLTGMDDGQSMLKIGLTLREEDKDEDNENKLSKSLRKDTGVKKLLLLSVFPDVPEVYTNIKLMLEDLGIESLEFTRTVNLKMALDWKAIGETQV